MKIKDLLKNKKTVSYEFFPPKEESQEEVLFTTVDKLMPLKPDFVSITYGAGGSTNKKTFEWTKRIIDSHKITAMMHFTCYGNTPDQIDKTCKLMLENNINNVMALRGDPPQNMDSSCCYPYAYKLVEHIKTRFPELSIGVAGYPEKHSQAKDLDSDIENLKLKVDAGADFIVTQLFFENEHFYNFMDKTAKKGINSPILAGIMPIINTGQIIKFSQMCGVNLPAPLLNKLEKASIDDVPKIGEEFAYNQVKALMEYGVNGIHYYTLNKYGSTYNILERLNS